MSTQAVNIPTTVFDEMAPTGRLRAAINFGNPVLARRDHNGNPIGISVELARILAEELRVDLEMVFYDAAGKVFASLHDNQWDVAFMAIEPVREKEIAFTNPYVVIEGTYLVKRESPYNAVAELDAPDVSIAVGKGAAYDLFLTRSLTAATLVRADTSAGAVDAFIEQKLDAAAGVRQPLQEVAASDEQYRVLEDSFTSIRQAMAVSRERTAAARYLHDFIERQIASGFVRSVLEELGQSDVTVPGSHA